MELHDNKKVFFDPISHTYLMGDKVLIGVTSLMSKHGLSPDYSGIPEATLMKAAAEGTAIHKEIEDYDNGVSVLRTPLIEEYITTCQEHGLIFVRNEFLISDDELVASSIDGVYGPENAISLVDYKTTQKVHRRSLEWQLGIYKVLFERQTSLKVENCYCLHIDKKERTIKGLVPIEPVSEAEVDALLQAEREGRIYIDLHEEPSAELVLTDAELTAYVAQQAEITRLKEQIKSIEETLKGLDARVLQYMTENNLEQMEGGGGVFKVKKAYERTTIDTARLKKMQPGIYDQYKKVTTIATSLTFKPNE